MDKRAIRYSQFALFILEFVAVNLVFRYAFFSSNTGVFDPFGNDLSLLYFFNVSWMAAVVMVRPYHMQNMERMHKLISSMIKTLGIQVFLVMAFVIFIKNFYIPKVSMFTNYGLLLLVLVSLRVLFRVWLSNFSVASYAHKNVVILGSGPVAKDLKAFFDTQRLLGYQFKGFFTWKNNPDQYVLELEKFCKDNDIHEIYYAHSDLSKDLIRQIVKYADNHLIRFKFALNFQGFLSKSADLEFFNSTPVFTYRKEPLESALNRLFKRIFDFVFSLFVIVCIFPFVFPIVIAIMMITMPGPIFFAQERSGRDNKVFKCLKFRSMTVNKESDKNQATRGDARITRWGSIMRKTSIDELPQFFNVLMGHMSVVGPRPHMLRHTEEYGALINQFMVRHLVKPGITGYAQVSGFRGGTEEDHQMEGRVSHDVYYLENWSLWFDVKLVFLTVWNVVKGEENAY